MKLSFASRWNKKIFDLVGSTTRSDEKVVRVVKENEDGMASSFKGRADDFRKKGMCTCFRAPDFGFC